MGYVSLQEGNSTTIPQPDFFRIPLQKPIIWGDQPVVWSL